MSQEEGENAMSTVVESSNPARAALPVVPLWIDGKPVPSVSQRSGIVTNPATGQVIRTVPFANAADVDAAVRAAAAAFPAWRDTPPLRRARILTRFRELVEQHAKEIAALVTEEHGKVFADAMGSVTRGIEVVEFAVGAPHLLKGELSENVGRGVDAYSRRQPIGVCAGITPFNFPAMVPMWMFPHRPRLRQHVHPEAVRKGSIRPGQAGGAAARSRPPRRRFQHRPWRQRSG